MSDLHDVVARGHVKGKLLVVPKQLIDPEAELVSGWFLALWAHDSETGRWALPLSTTHVLIKWASTGPEFMSTAFGLGMNPPVQ